MAGRKRIARSAAPPASPGDWIRDRPRFPSVYGISESAEGLLPWSHVDERMSKALRYWVSSVDGEGRPHATPVDGMWIDGKLYFGGNPATRRNRNLVANPAACIHLEEAMDVVILHGDAPELDAVSPELSERIIQNSKDEVRIRAAGRRPRRRRLLRVRAEPRVHVEGLHQGRHPVPAPRSSGSHAGGHRLRASAAGKPSSKAAAKASTARGQAEARGQAGACGKAARKKA